MRKYPNININLYDGDFATGFDCPGTQCKFKMCDIMPPEKDAKCFYDKFECNCKEGRIAAIKAVIRKLKIEFEDLEEE